MLRYTGRTVDKRDKGLGFTPQIKVVETKFWAKEPKDSGNWRCIKIEGKVVRCETRRQAREIIKAKLLSLTLTTQ